MKRTACLTSLVLFLLATSSVRAGDIDGNRLAYLGSATAQLGVVGNAGLPVQYSESNLVANRAGLEASQIDPQLINAWGVTSCRLETERQESFEGSAQNSLFCVAAAGAGVVTIYTRSGLKIPLEVTIPAAPGLPPGTLGSPAGIVFNSTAEFVISKNGKSGPALLLIAALDGTISGWNPDVDATNAVTMVDYSANKPNRPFPAVYQGLAIGRDGHQRNVLYGVDGGGTARPPGSLSRRLRPGFCLARGSDSPFVRLLPSTEEGALEPRPPAEPAKDRPAPLASPGASCSCASSAKTSCSALAAAGARSWPSSPKGSRPGHSRAPRPANDRRLRPPATQRLLELRQDYTNLKVVATCEKADLGKTTVKLWGGSPSSIGSCRSRSRSGRTRS